jgi:hypothetical protein
MQHNLPKEVLAALIDSVSPEETLSTSCNRNGVFQRAVYHFVQDISEFFKALAIRLDDTNYPCSPPRDQLKC